MKARPWAANIEHLWILLDGYSNLITNIKWIDGNLIYPVHFCIWFTNNLCVRRGREMPCLIKYEQKNPSMDKGFRKDMTGK